MRRWSPFLADCGGAVWAGQCADTLRAHLLDAPAAQERERQPSQDGPPGLGDEPRRHPAAGRRLRAPIQPQLIHAPLSLSLRPEVHTHNPLVPPCSGAAAATSRSFSGRPLLFRPVPPLPRLARRVYANWATGRNP